MSESTMRYVLRRLNWRQSHYGLLRMPGSLTIGTFDTFEEAETEHRGWEDEVRGRVNPFKCGASFAFRSRLPEPIFLDWLRDVGIEPPGSESTASWDWPAWWEQVRSELTPEQIAHVWAGLDLVRFYEVVARPACPVGYAVVEVQWEYNDNWMEPGDEGGSLVRVYRRRVDAEAYLRRLNGSNVSEPDEGDEDDEDGLRYEANRWLDEPNWPFIGPTRAYKTTRFASERSAVRFEIVEIELSGLTVVERNNG